VNVLGIDPSITATGLAVSTDVLTVVGGHAKDGDERLATIHQAVTNLAQRWHVDLAVLEDLPTHAHGAGLTGMVQGVVRHALLTIGVPYATVPAATLKKFATGRGTADKADMRMALYKRLWLDEANDNKVDALWLWAAGKQHLGEPIVQLPASQVAALDKVKWPALRPDIQLHEETA
jgi:Holliday junction resolvasome RuvABC endonuclease subunit